MFDEPGSTSGYKRPPLHTRFKPGQSGNPNGRPKKKGATFAESIERELNTSITVVEAGKRRRITKLEAIVKQQTNKAVNGDPKATALLLSAIERRESDALDTLSPVLHAMRAIHGKHESANQNGTETADVFQAEATAMNQDPQAGHDQD
jgi:Family of unknown function (DUF5681)